MTTHTYRTRLARSGSTSSYEGYDRAHDVTVGAAPMRVSADAAFHGHPALADPEAMLVAAAGQVGAQVLQALRSRGWIVPSAGSRSVRLTDDGRCALSELAGA